jgi:hypothetical protein
MITKKENMTIIYNSFDEYLTTGKPLKILSFQRWLASKRKPFGYMSVAEVVEKLRVEGRFPPHKADSF